MDRADHPVRRAAWLARLAVQSFVAVLFLWGGPLIAARRVRLEMRGLIERQRSGLEPVSIGTYSLFEVREFTLVAGQVLDLGSVAIPVHVQVPVVVTAPAGGELPTFPRLGFERDLGGTWAGRRTPTPYMDLDGKGAG